MRLESSNVMGDPREISCNRGTMELRGGTNRKRQSQRESTVIIRSGALSKMRRAIVSSESAHPVIIFVVMDVIRSQRCLRKRALKAKLYRSLQRKREQRRTLSVKTYELCGPHQQHDMTYSYFNQMTQSVRGTVK